MRAEAAPAGMSPDSGYFREEAALASAVNGFSRLRSTFSSPLVVLMGLVTLVLLTIVNQSLARYFFGDENPVGRAIAPWDGRSVQPDRDIIGVVEDAVHFDLKEPPKRVLYAPSEQGPDFLARANMILAGRSTSPAAQFARWMRDLVGQFDRNARRNRDAPGPRGHGVAREQLLAVLSGFLGTLSLLLVAVGLYGVMAYSVACRTAEFGSSCARGTADQRAGDGLARRLSHRLDRGNGWRHCRVRSEPCPYRAALWHHRSRCRGVRRRGSGHGRGGARRHAPPRPPGVAGRPDSRAAV